MQRKDSNQLQEGEENICFKGSNYNTNCRDKLRDIHGKGYFPQYFMSVLRVILDVSPHKEEAYVVKFEIGS